MAKNELTDQGYLSLQEAAKYCGYTPKYFSRLTCEFRIPKYGPRATRFKRIDLDFFMENPTFFQSPEAHLHVRAPGQFTALA